MPVSRALLLTILVWTTGSLSAQPVIGPGVADALAETGSVRVVVALDDGISTQRLAAASLDHVRARVAGVQEALVTALPSGGVEAVDRFETIPAVVLTITSQAALTALGAHDGVRQVDLDGGGGTGGGQAGGGLGASVPLVRATEWHTRGVTGNGVVVAVLDTGIDTDHPDFAGAIVDQSCFLDSNGSVDGVGQCPNGSDRQTGAGSAEDDNGHGSNVTGVLASRGTVSDVGVAPGVDIVAVKTINSSNRFRSFSEIVAALDYLIAHPGLGVRIVNMSLGSGQLFGAVCDNSTSWTMAGARAVAALRARGVALYASSMNEGSPTSVAAPACLSGVTAVAATTLADEMASISNTGPQVEMAAPGVLITASGWGGGTSTYTGTSQASPHVAGCAALLLEGGAAATPDEINAALRAASTVTVTDPDNGRTFPRLGCWDASFVVSTDDGAADREQVSLPSPNPSRSRTRVTVEASAPQTVRAVLLDGLGRFLWTAYEGRIGGDTPHVLTVDVRALPAGVYTLRITGESFDAARRVLVVR